MKIYRLHILTGAYSAFIDFDNIKEAETRKAQIENSFNEFYEFTCFIQEISVPTVATLPPGKRLLS